MTISANYQNQPIPAYSGVTINVTHPNMNAGNPICNHPQPQMQTYSQCPCQYSVSQIPTYTQPQAVNAYNAFPQTVPPQQQMDINKSQYYQPQYQAYNPTEGNTATYPAQYYLNNYNYLAENSSQGQPTQAMQPNTNIPPQVIKNEPALEELNQVPYNMTQEESIEDTRKSTEIISELDNRLNEQKDLEKNGKKTKIIALTDEYIMSLENYLNNPNSEIRLMAAKEVLTRFDEDKNRFNDAALNALVNKMLQDPEKLIRIAALSALSSQLASGNDYTVQLLNQIQNNPNADKEDVVQAADILLKMSADTETRYTQVSTITTPTKQPTQQEK